MKRLIIITLILISCVSCKKAPLTNGDVVTRTTELSSFNTINIYNNIDVNLIKSDTFKIEITTGENLMENIVFEVADSILYLRNENILNWIRSYDYPLNANIYFKDDIKEIYYESVGHLKSDDYLCNDTLSALTLNIMGGSGDIDLKFKCRSYNLFVGDDCTSNICLIGEAIYGNINQRGLGPIYAEELLCRNLSVRSTDVNDIYVNCLEKLNVQIYHSGNVYYKGHPEISLYIAPNARGKLVSINNY